jgi:hypothetical protein
MTAGYRGGLSDQDDWINPEAPNDPDFCVV